MLDKSQVKYIQSLSQKKFRDQEQAFAAEGPKIINELLSSENIGIISFFATKNWIEENGDLAKKIVQGKLIEVKEKELERISFLQTPNQALAVFNKPLFKKSVFKNKITLLLDGIQDPGNLGTLLRTADWFGIDQVVCSKETADVFNPKVVQSTMGSIARVQVTYEDLEPFIANHSSIPVYATVLKGKNLFSVKPVQEAFILIGNESKGIGENLSALASEHIMIPRVGKAESLNASIAGAIVMAHLVGGPK